MCPGNLLTSKQRFALFTSEQHRLVTLQLLLLFWSLGRRGTRRRREVFVLFCCWALTLDRPVLAAPTKQRILAVDRRRTPYCRAHLFTCTSSGYSVSTFFRTRVLRLWNSLRAPRHVLVFYVQNVRLLSEQTRVMACDRWRVIASILVSISAAVSSGAHKMADPPFPSVTLF